jgi:hypothetical protein
MMRMLTGVLVSLLAVQSTPVEAQVDSVQPATPPVAMAARPYGPGERMEYVARYGWMNPGRASMEVVGVADVRGRPALHTRFSLKGRLVVSVNYLLESWVDLERIASVRFQQDSDDDPAERDRAYEIFPDRQTYSVNGGEEMPSVRDPLDEGALLYHVRTMDLEVGKTYELNRYFRPDRNPVIIKVLRRETISVPAGKFNTIVIQPIIKSRGLFSEGGQAHIYLSDDPERIMVQMRVRLRIGSISLQLTSYRPPTHATK